MTFFHRFSDDGMYGPSLSSPRDRRRRGHRSGRRRDVFRSRPLQHRRQTRQLLRHARPASATRPSLPRWLWNRTAGLSRSDSGTRLPGRWRWLGTWRN